MHSRERASGLLRFGVSLVVAITAAWAIASPAAATSCATKTATADVYHSSAGSNIDATYTLHATICVANGVAASFSNYTSHTQPGSNVTYVSGYSTQNRSPNKLIVDFAGSGTFKLERSLQTDCKETVSAHIVGKVTIGGSVTWTVSTHDQTFLNILALATCYHT
jgi:hypothetical protein